jgi:hypothetical protein
MNLRPLPRAAALALMLAAALALGGCLASGKREAGNGRPAWIDQPGEGVSAAAAFHVMGRQAQEELAITRAREEYAKRYGVTVSSDHVMQQSVTQNQSATRSDKKVTETVRDKDVKARVAAKWLDPDGTLWVWLVPAR